MFKISSSLWAELKKAVSESQIEEMITFSVVISFFMSVFKYIFLCQDFGQKRIKKEPRKLRGSNVSYCLTENQNITDFFAWSWKCMSWYI